MLRTAFILPGIVVLTAFYSAVVLVAGLFRVTEKPNGIYQWCMHGWSRAILRLSGVKLVVHNPERMSAVTGQVYIANHVSWYDIFALAALVPRGTWIAKGELTRIPFFAQAATSFGIVFIDRDNRKMAFTAYRAAAEQVKKGRSVIICPEGTRGRDYHLRPFKKGPFVLAIQAGAPVIPTLLYGTREVMPKGSFIVRPGPVHVHFLEPVPTAGLSYEQRAELMETVWGRMADEMRRVYGIQTAEHAIAPVGERKE